MIYTDKSELLLKYQKTKAKLIEFDVPNDLYPNFPLDSNDLSFLTVYLLSLYSESIIGKDDNRQRELKPLLIKAAQFFDSVFESKDRPQRNQDFLLTGAAAYFLNNDFGSAKVLCSKVDSCNSIINTPFKLLCVCLQYLLMNKTHDFGDETTYFSNIYESMVAFFCSGKDDGYIITLLSDFRNDVLNYGNGLDSFYADLLCAIIIFAIQKSARRLLPQFSRINVDIWNTYLGRREAIKILWQSQELLCKYGVLQGKNAIVQLPTGVGKTKSIELIIRSAQLSNRTSEIVIVAPLRALCNEITHDLQYAFRADNVELNQFSDIMEDDYSFGVLEDNCIRISICTPEKLNYIIHHQPDICSKIGLFILDEAHMFDDGARGITYEFLVTTIHMLLGDSQQLVLLSAVMSNANDIKHWLFGEEGILATDDSIATTPKAVGFYNKNSIVYYSGDPLSQDFFIPLSISPQTLQRVGRERKLRLFPEKDNARDIALYYGIRLCKNGGAAIYVDTTLLVRTTIERLIYIQERGYTIKSIVDCADTTEMIKVSQLISKYYGINHPYSLASQYGILPHHSRLPNGVKLSVEYALRKSYAHFVVCTSTLAQGVNIPIKYLIMTGMTNKRNVQKRVRSFQNLIGRTARAGMYTEGSVLITNTALYAEKDEYKSGGKYRWNECCELFSRSNAEPCTSSLLILISRIETGKDRCIKAEDIVQYILNHYHETGCFDELQTKIIKTIIDNQHEPDKNSIAEQLSARKQVLESIENYFCFVYSTLLSDHREIPDDIGRSICKRTLGYYLANDNEREMLLSIFHMTEEKVASLNTQQHIKYSAAMTSIECGKLIESWIADVDLVNHFYTESDFLCLLVGLYEKLYSKRIDANSFLNICQQWIQGTMPLDMLPLLPSKDIDQLLDICHKCISYEMSFLVGNIIDLLPRNDEDEANELYSMLSLLQRKLKYGVPNLTSVSICESLFWDRFISKEMSRVISNENITSSELKYYLILNETEIRELLSEMPSYFTDRFSTVIKQPDT